MRTLATFACVLAGLAASAAHADGKYAILMGSSGQSNHEFYADIVARYTILKARGFDVRVLYGSDRHPAVEAEREFAAAALGFRLSAGTLREITALAKPLTVENYQNELHALERLRPGPPSELYLYLTAHAEGFFGKHHTRWGSESPSSGKVIELLRPILQTGTRVYYDSSSCYDGRILEIARDALSEFSRNFCATTITVGNRRSSTGFANLFTVALPPRQVRASGGGFVLDGPLVSVTETFIERQYPDTQISTLPEWVKIEEKLEKHSPMRIQDILALGDQDPELRAYLAKELERSRAKCSPAAREQINRAVDAEVAQVVQSYGRTTVLLDQSEIPEKACKDWRGQPSTSCEYDFLRLYNDLYLASVGANRNYVSGQPLIVPLRVLEKMSRTRPELARDFVSFIAQVKPKADAVLDVTCEKEPWKLAMKAKAFLLKRKSAQGPTACDAFQF